MKTIDKLLSEKMMTLVRCNTQEEGQAMADALMLELKSLKLL
jgi:hypothetical protein